MINRICANMARSWDTTISLHRTLRWRQILKRGKYCYAISRIVHISTANANRKGKPKTICDLETQSMWKSRKDKVGSLKGGWGKIGRWRRRREWKQREKDYGQKKTKEMKEDTEKIRRLRKKRKELRRTEMSPVEKNVVNLIKKENEEE